jgi:GrpB-like predicted nucleotidyltransferase (UPF0157 family)
MIGLQRGIVKLFPYDPQWAILFEEEKAKLQKILGANVKGIEHIGSTAMPGISAKPVIDIAVGIEDMNAAESIKNILEANGWIWRPKFGDIANHIVFAKGTKEERTHYLHLMQYEGEKWKERIAFRDYLISHEVEKKEYEQLKQKSMESFGNDRKAYTAEKDEFVQRILQKALN